jgi:hypothetical protein
LAEVSRPNGRWFWLLPQEADVYRVRVDFALAAVQGVLYAQAAQVAVLVPRLIQEGPRLSVAPAHGTAAKTAHPFGFFPAEPTAHGLALGLS